MTPVEAARRLGVHETAVRTVDERENDAVVTLRDGSRMLVSDTVARPYVPGIDDEPEADETADGTVDDDTEAKPRKAARSKKAPGAA